MALTAIATAALCFGAAGVGVARADAPAVSLTSDVVGTAAPGQLVTFTATVTGTTIPSGAIVRFSVQGGSIINAPVDSSGVVSQQIYAPASGSLVVKAIYYSDPTDIPDATSAPVTVTVGVPATSSLALTATPATPTAGDVVTLTATLTTSGNAAAPTGTITFYDSTDNGATQHVVASSPVGAGGVTTVQLGGFQGGSHLFSARYGGDATYPAAAAPAQSLQVQPAPSAVQTTITAGASPSSVVAGQLVTLTAHVTQAGDTTLVPTGGLVTFRNAATGTLIDQAPIDGNGNVSIGVGGWVAGTYTITATYIGDSSEYTSSSASFSLVATSLPQLVVTAPSPTVTYGDAVPTLTPTYSVAGATLTTAPTCTTTYTQGSPVGSYPVTCAGGTSSDYSLTEQDGSLTVGPAQLTVTPPSATITAGSPLPTLTPTIAGFVGGDTAAVVSGAASCTTTATTDSPAGSYPVTCTTGTLSATNYTFTVAGTGSVTITGGSTATRIVDWVSGPLVAGKPVLLSATLFAGSRPLGGKTVTLGLGSASCTAVTLPLLGTAFCTVTAPTTLGPTTSSATFAGDGTYAPATDTNDALLYAFPTDDHGHGCGFVVGDRSDSGRVTFWGSQWTKSNSFSGGASSGASSFKGFGGAAGSDWSTGATSNPPSSLPSYMGVYVTSSVAKHGSSLSGTIVGLVIVKTDAGYDGTPGHAGTGTVVATVS